MKNILAIAACASSVAIAAPAYAVVIDIPLGVIIVPPTQTFSPGLTFAQAGDNGADFDFVISQAMTLTVSSFINSSIGNTGLFDFTSIGLYSGLGTMGDLLQSGTITTDGNSRRASLNQFSLNQGSYTIAFRGLVTGPPASVGSSITFAADAMGGGVPEPATWALMLVGFGGIGFAMRRRKVATRVTITSFTAA